jgi:hypothetical protein
MTEKFESDFHKRYVGGQGDVEEKETFVFPAKNVEKIPYDEILAEYRKYVGDSDAELPGELLLFSMFS